MKMKLIISGLLFIAISFNAKSQDYVNSVGFRAGLYNGISYKHFLSTTDAAEVILTTRDGRFSLAGLYERHLDSFDVDRLYFYYGAGGHIGSWNGDANSSLVIGIDGIVGIEYVFTEIPFNISLDWKPGIDLIGNSRFWGDELALSFRFIF